MEAQGLVKKKGVCVCVYVFLIKWQDNRREGKRGDQKNGWELKREKKERGDAV